MKAFNQNTSSARKYLGEVIRECRLDKHKLTLEEMAEKCDIDPNNLSRIERGEYFPSFPTLIQIMTVLDLDLRVHVKTLHKLLHKSDHEA